MTIFTVIILLIILVIFYFIAKSGMSRQKKLIIIIGIIALIIGSISYVFVTGFDRGMRLERQENAR